MTRAFDFTVVAIIYIIAAVIHLMSVELFAPGTPLYQLAVTDTAVMNGQQWADRAYMILAAWMPIMAAGGITGWAVVREYRRQALSAVSRGPL